MLYPINNPYRQYVTLNGFWDFRMDPEDQGLDQAWSAGFSHNRPVAVPASWNDQFEDGRDFLGPAWYQKRFSLPWGWDDQKILLRFNSVNYLAQVWLNGKMLGRHEGGHLPFIFDITDALIADENKLVVRVDGRLAQDRVPPGNITGSDLDFFSNHSENYPQAQFDFFPYCGIHRSVLLFAQPNLAFEDITVITDLKEKGSSLCVRVKPESAQLRVLLSADGQKYQSSGAGEVRLELPQIQPWSPDTPCLYPLTVERMEGHQVLDRYTLPIGFRTVAVEGDTFLLNGKPVYLQGFGRHEDFPISGRGLNLPVIIKDYALMQWVGANSFRTSHYPYSEQMMRLADQLGFMVIDETPAVGLFFNSDGFEHRQRLCRQYIKEMILRDKNHPSVIAWSLANEPHTTRAEAKPFFKDLYELAISLDQTRPVTLVSFMGVMEEAFEFLDFMCLNRYFGWYQESGQIERGAQFLSHELDLLHQTYHKPILLTEFGADTIPGHHAQPPEMFSEEYQAEFIRQYIDVLRSKPYVIGEHVWNMCDFRTSQGITRMGGYNYKGVFTRDRRPKMAAHVLREIWTQESEAS